MSFIFNAFADSIDLGSVLQTIALQSAAWIIASFVGLEEYDKPAELYN